MVVIGVRGLHLKAGVLLAVGVGAPHGVPFVGLALGALPLVLGHQLHHPLHALVLHPDDEHQEHDDDALDVDLPLLGLTAPWEPGPPHSMRWRKANADKLLRRNVEFTKKQWTLRMRQAVPHTCVWCVWVCVICTYGGGSLCSVGLDASFGSGLLRPLCDVISRRSAESEPLYCAG